MDTGSILKLTLEVAAVAMVTPIVAAGARVMSLSRYQRHVRNSRAGETYADFTQSLAGTGISAPLLEATYRLLSDELALVPGMPVRAADKLSDLYGVGLFGGTHPNELAQWVLENAGYGAREVAITERVTTVAEFLQAVSRIADARPTLTRDLSKVRRLADLGRASQGAMAA